MRPRGLIRKLRRTIRGGGVPAGAEAPSAAPQPAGKSEPPARVVLQRRLRRHLAKEWGWEPDLRFHLPEASGLAPKDLMIRREKDAFALFLPAEMKRKVLMPGIVPRAASYLLQFREAEGAEEMVVTLSDGELPGSYRFSPSTPSPDVTRIVDAYFFRFRGYEGAEAAFAEAPDWQDRDDRLVWRGAPNGTGTLTWDPAMLEATGLMPRCRLVLTCLGTEIDAKLVFNPGHKFAVYAPFFAAAGVLADHKPQMSWARHRYALDIDGHSNAWNNFLVRLKLGCCVLKVASEQGYSQWYYDRLRPWEHFVPVKSDMSDLAEQYDWVRANPNKAKDIAEAGRAVAGAMTFKAEWAEGARLIVENWAR